MHPEGSDESHFLQQTELQHTDSKERILSPKSLCPCDAGEWIRPTLPASPKLEAGGALEFPDFHVLCPDTA